MPSEEDLKKARELWAHIWGSESKVNIEWVYEQIATALSQARQEEREECAKVAEGFDRVMPGIETWVHQKRTLIGAGIADAIRSRGVK